MEGVSQDWVLERQIACWDSGASEFRGEGRAELKLAILEFKEQSEAAGVRSGDSTSKKATWLLGCRSRKLKDAGQRAGEG